MIIDICGDISISYLPGEARPEKALSAINQLITDSDWKVANFEMAFMKEKTPVIKDGPNLGVDEGGITLLENLQFDAYTLANNHVGDYGEDGIQETITIIEKKGKQTIGAGSAEKRYEPVRINQDGLKISVFSFCENEFGVFDRFGVAGYVPELVCRKIMEEKRNTDWVLVIFHGGAEYYPLPTPQMKKRYHALVDAGSDLVVGMHQHCVCGHEEYKGSDIFYGLGNLYFPRASRSAFPGWEYGFVLRLTVNDGKLSYQKKPYHFDYRGESFELIKEEDFEAYFDQISKPISDDVLLDRLFCAWCLMSGENKRKKLISGISSFDDSKATAFVKNAFSCETHRELFAKYFEMAYLSKQEEKYPYDEIKQYMNMESFLKRQQQKIENVKYVFWGIGEKAQSAYEKLQEGEKDKAVFADGDPLKQGLFYLGRFNTQTIEQTIVNHKDARFFLCMNNGQKKAKDYLLQQGIKNDQIMEVF